MKNIFFFWKFSFIGSGYLHILICINKFLHIRIFSPFSSIFLNFQTICNSWGFVLETLANYAECLLCIRHLGLMTIFKNLFHIFVALGLSIKDALNVPKGGGEKIHNNHIISLFNANKNCLTSFMDDPFQWFSYLLQDIGDRLHSDSVQINRREQWQISASMLKKMFNF